MTSDMTVAATDRAFFRRLGQAGGGTVLITPALARLLLSGSSDRLKVIGPAREEREINRSLENRSLER